MMFVLPTLTSAALRCGHGEIAKLRFLIRGGFYVNLTDNLPSMGKNSRFGETGEEETILSQLPIR